MISTPPTSAQNVEPIRVVLIGNERVTRAGLRMLIDSEPGLRVIDEQECAGDLGAVWFATRPQVVVIDLDGTPNDEFLPNLRAPGTSNTRVVVLTSTPDSAACATAVQRGVLGIVSKQQAPEVLIKAIECVDAGEVWLTRTKIAGVLGGLRASAAAANQPPKMGPSELLAPRERQILGLVARGFRNSEIAETILVSEATVRNCLGSIFRKLGVSNRVQLMIFAIQKGLVNLEQSGTRSTPASARDVLRLATNAGRPIGERRQS